MLIIPVIQAATPSTGLTSPLARGLPVFGDYAIILREWIFFEWNCLLSKGFLGLLIEFDEICFGYMCSG